MKYLLIIVIQIYWKIIPVYKRKKCIYRISCSQYVYEATQKLGLKEGLKALRYRMGTCNSNFVLYQNPITRETQLLLSNGESLIEKEIAERLINLN